MKRSVLVAVLPALLFLAWGAQGGPGPSPGPEAVAPAPPALSPAESATEYPGDEEDPFAAGGPADLVVLSSGDARGETIPCG